MAGVGRDFNDNLVPTPPCCGQGCHQLDQGAKGTIQPQFDQLDQFNTLNCFSSY